MSNKKERLENLNEEDFYFIFFDGTRMPNNSKYVKITMFKDTLYVENEKVEKENYKDMYFIIKVRKMIEDNLDKIEKMLIAKSMPIKSSSNHEFVLKINNKTYRIDRFDSLSFFSIVLHLSIPPLMFSSDYILSGIFDKCYMFII